MLVSRDGTNVNNEISKYWEMKKLVFRLATAAVLYGA